MTIRINIEVLASGQPRPYADSRRHVRMTLEYHFAWLGDPNHEKSEWRPQDYLTEEKVKEIFRNTVGFPDEPAKDWAAERLSYLKKTAPGVWEFYATSAYTD